MYVCMCVYIQSHEYERNARGDEKRKQGLRARIVRVSRRLMASKHEALGGTDWTAARKEVYVFGYISDRRGGGESIRSRGTVDGRTSGGYQLPEVGLRRTNQGGGECESIGETHDAEGHRKQNARVDGERRRIPIQTNGTKPHTHTHTHVCAEPHT